MTPEEASLKEQILRMQAALNELNQLCTVQTQRSCNLAADLAVAQAQVQSLSASLNEANISLAALKTTPTE